MSPVIESRNRVEAKPGIMLPNGLLSAATLVPITDTHDEMGVDWQPLSCGEPGITGWCIPEGDAQLDRYPELDGATVDKTFITPAYRSSPPVTVYAGVECSVVGFPYSEALDRARSILNVGEQAALERWTWGLLQDEATDVTEAVGDESVVGRLSDLEAALATIYPGIGVVHVPIVLASFMASNGLLWRDGAKLKTFSGHLVSIGAGYPITSPANANPPDGTAWMYISGPVTVRQGSVDPVPEDQAYSVRITDNQRMAIAERTSVVQVECGAFAALADKECCSSDIGLGS